MRCAVSGLGTAGLEREVWIAYLGSLLRKGHQLGADHGVARSEGWCSQCACRLSLFERYVRAKNTCWERLRRPNGALGEVPARRRDHLQ